MILTCQHPYYNDIYEDALKKGIDYISLEDIIHLMRGQIFDIDGRTFFTFGGAYSIDRSDRIEDVSWFREELPTADEYEEGWKNLEKVDFDVDYI